MLKDFLKGKFSIMPGEKGDPEKESELQKEIDMANRNLAKANAEKKPKVYEIRHEDIKDDSEMEKDYRDLLNSLEHTIAAIETLSVQLIADKNALIEQKLYDANRAEAVEQIGEIKKQFKKGKFPLMDEKLEKLIMRMENSFMDAGSSDRVAA